METRIEQIFGDLNQKLEELKSFYKKARIKILAAEINEKFFLYFGNVLFLDDDIKKDEERFYNYSFDGINKKSSNSQINKIYFIQKDEILENTMNFVGNIFENREINLKQPEFDICEIDFQSPSEIRTFHRSNFPSVIFPYVWPTYRYHLNIKSDNSQVKNGLVSQEKLFSIDAPLYPNIMRGFEHFFSLKRKLDYRLPEPMLSFILPDYRGRIKEVNVNDNNFSVQVEHKFPTKGDLSVKYYYTTETGHNYSKENHKLDENSSLLINTFGYPFNFGCCLLYKGEILDLLDYQAEYGVIDERIIQNNSKIIERLIFEGENEQIEFKQEYNGKNKHEFFETVVSFSNTRGGTILLGVTDTCQIMGLEKPLKDKDSIEDDLNKFCRPRLDDVVVNIIKMADGKEIISILIPEGNEKPYFLIDSNRDEKAYIRKGSSDRKMKREEFERIYQDRTSNQGAFGYYGKGG